MVVAVVTGRLLLMGSSGFKADVLPVEVRERLDVALEAGMEVVVGEAHGSCRLFQDYLHEKDYRKVTVGHARSIRYNAGGWPTRKYGDSLKEREKALIEDCDSAIIIWSDHSGVIAENLEYLKRLNKLTFIYEYDSKKMQGSFGQIDLRRNYRK